MSPSRLPAGSQQAPSRLPADSQQTPSRLPADSQQTPSRLPADSQQARPPQAPLSQHNLKKVPPIPRFEPRTSPCPPPPVLCLTPSHVSRRAVPCIEMNRGSDAAPGPMTAEAPERGLRTAAVSVRLPDRPGNPKGMNESSENLPAGRPSPGVL
ncbi:unnamed protein product [Arctogadus glacialis]